MIERTKTGYRLTATIRSNGTISIPAKLRELIKVGLKEDIVVDVPEKQEKGT